jgi:signal transduction histidine kinase
VEEQGVNTLSAVPTNRQLLFCRSYCLLLALSSSICWSTLVKAQKTPASIGDPAKSNRPQIGHDSWGFKEGAPDAIVALAQTGDGYLWIASPNGLVRFDGRRFERYRPSVGPELVSTNIFGLFAPASGGLWIGYRFGGFSFLKDGRLTNYTRDAASTGTVFMFLQDQNDIVWAATNSGIWRFEHSEWQHLGAEWNAPKTAPYIGSDQIGYLWVLSGKSLVYLAPGAKRFEVAEQDLNAAGYPGDSRFIHDADGFVVTSKSWKPRNAPETGGPPAYPLLKENSFGMIDRSGGLWMGYKYLAHLWLAGSVEDSVKAARMKVAKVPPTDHMSASIVPRDAGSVENYSIEPSSRGSLVDHEGNIWFGGVKGLDRFFYKPFVQPVLASLVNAVGIASDGEGGIWAGGQESPLFYLHSGQQEISITDGWVLNVVYLAPDNTLWIGEGNSGLWHETLSKVRPAGGFSKWSRVLNTLFEYTGRNWEFISLPPEVADHVGFVQAITQDQQGRLWVSLGRHGLYRYADGSWVANGGRNDFPQTGVVSEFTDAAGRIWFGFTRNELAVLDGDSLRVFGPNDGLSVGNVLTIAGRSRDVWIGGDLGLQRYLNGRLVTINAMDNEMLRGISGIIERANGDLWLNGLTGVFHISQAEVSRALQDAHRVTGEHFGGREGLPGYAAQLRPLPSAVEAPDGRLWFAVNNGVVWLDPDHSQQTATLIPVSIQSVYADDKYYDLDTPLRFPAHTSNVEINYIAVRLSAPDSVHYRYKLQETDKDWREVQTAEPVTFRNLPPGSYHFVVAASDTNGAWSDKVAHVDFTIAPAFYQTIWFRLAVVATVLLLTFGLYRLRLRQATARLNALFDERLAERTRIARELHDTLLQTVQGSKLVAEDALERSNDSVHVRGALEKLTRWLGQATQEGRAALNSLRTSTIETNDLAAALRRATEECLGNNSMDVEFSVTGDWRDMHPIARDEIYRIGYEAIHNACEHSSASNLEISINYGRDLMLRVKDNGAGIEEAVITDGKAEHFGLRGMRERARRIESKLTLVSSPGTGTELTLIVPGAVVFRTGSATPFERIKSLVRRRHSDLSLR